MSNCHQLVCVACFVGGLAIATSGGIARTADRSDAINKAITEWREKEPTWAYPGAEREHGPGMFSFTQLDQRTRITFGRPLAKSLAKACGKPGVKVLQERVEKAPELILLALDELEASDVVAECVVTLLGKEKVNVAEDWPFVNKAHLNADVLVWASLCSPATRRAAALALLRMPPVTEVRPSTFFPTHMVFTFVAAVGDRDTLTAAETAAKDSKRAGWRQYYEEVASFIRRREALAPRDRDIRAKNDLLFWQANVDGIGYHVASMSCEQSAQTLANQHERISTDYLLGKLREVAEEASRENYEDEHHLPHPPRLTFGSVGLILCILGKQRDPAAISALEEFAKKYPTVETRVRRTIEAIKGTTVARPENKTGVSGFRPTPAQPNAGPAR